jgi:uncharacterized membrane protein YccC
MLAWGIRMTIAIIVPLIWGIYTGNLDQIVWSIAACECIGWVELKGSFAQRIRILSAGTILSVFFGFIGTLSANNLVLSLILMLFVVFIASLFKNLGERGAGLSLSVYVMFIVCNAHPIPPHHVEILYERLEYIAIGGVWTLFVGAVSSLFMSENTPYKRAVAFIWKATADLANAIDQGWDGKNIKANVRTIYLKEKEVHNAISSSLELYDKRTYYSNHDSESAKNMSLLRKSVSLISTTLSTIQEELEQINPRELTGPQRQSIHAILKSIEIICERMTIFTVTNKIEEEMIMRSRVLRLQNMCLELKDGTYSETNAPSIEKLIHFTERIAKLVDNAITQIMDVAVDQKVYRSYSLMKTLLILHHKHWIESVQRLANINAHSFRFALRTALLAVIALFISKWFKIPFGYWLPFSLLIVVQQYFNATLKKAIDRVLGTVLGVLIGGWLLMLPSEFHMKEILIATTPLLMVYFLRKKYSISTFFISVFLVALFAVEGELTNEIILIRAACTLGGSLLAVGGVFLLLPTWDKNWLPKHIHRSIEGNFKYFMFTFYPNQFDTTHQWMYYRRNAETENGNAFESFNRFMAEPTTKGKHFILYYQLIAHSIRITRELNNFHISSDQIDYKKWDAKTFEPYKQQIIDCFEMFKIIYSHSTKLSKNELDEQLATMIKEITLPSSIPMSNLQIIYLDKLSIELSAYIKDFEKLKLKNKQQPDFE